jgi:hypothetical protein
LLLALGFGKTIWVTFDLLFHEGLNEGHVLLLEASELLGQVDNETWAQESTSIFVAVTIDVITIQELFIKHYDNLVICLSNHSTSKTKWNVLSVSRIHVHDTVTNREIID